MSAVAYSPLNELPGPYEVGNMFRVLMGRPVEAKIYPGAPGAVSGTDQIAVYVDDHGEIMAICLCSVGLSAAVGAALSMLSPQVAHDASARHGLPDNMRENHFEVMNISARFFNSPYSPHVRLQAVHQVDQGLPQPVRTALGRLGAWSLLEVEVEDYGRGMMLLAHIGQTVEQNPEFRAHTRATIAAQVVFTTLDGDMVMGMARDLSLRGSYITCDQDQMLDVGANCTLLFLGPVADGLQQRKVKVGAQVVRRDGQGLAVRFTRVSEEAQAVIGELVMRTASDPDKIAKELKQL